MSRLFLYNPQRQAWQYQATIANRYLARVVQHQFLLGNRVQVEGREVHTLRDLCFILGPQAA